MRFPDQTPSQRRQVREEPNHMLVNLDRTSNGSKMVLSNEENNAEGPAKETKVSPSASLINRTLQILVYDVLGFDPISTRIEYTRRARKCASRRRVWSETQRRDGGAGGGNSAPIDWDAFLDVLSQSSPELLSGARLESSSFDGFLLHAACACAAPSDVIQQLLRLTPPEALARPCGGVGMLATPLHLACFFRCSCEAVSLLLLAAETPACLLLADALGRLPLHVACLTGQSADSPSIVRLLLGADPELKSLGAKDACGSTPLQVAAQRATQGVVEALLSAYAEADRSGKLAGVTAADVRRQLPLHRALQRYPGDGDGRTAVSSLDVFAAGTRSSSESLLHTKDRRGRLPLHLACQYGTEKSVFRDLIVGDVRGEGFDTRDGSHRTPSDVLIARILSDDPRALRTLQDLADADESRRFFGRSDEGGQTMLDRLVGALGNGNKKRAVSARLSAAQREAVLCVVSCTPPGSSGRYPLSIKRSREVLGSQVTYNRIYRDPRLHRTLNNIMCKRAFTFYFMVDLYVRIMMVVLYTLCSNYAANDAWLSPGYFAWLYACGAYLLLWQVRLAWHHQLYYLGEFWNLLDLATNLLVFVSVGLLQSGKPNEGGYRVLNVAVGGLVWFVILAVALRSTFKYFSVFLHGLTMILAYMTAFGICLVLMFGSFAEMYYKSTSGRLICDLRQPPAFCFYGASFLKVYSMFVVGIDSALLVTETPGNLLILTIFYGFFFPIVMLNVLVAVVFDAWGRVSPIGEQIFFSNRHVFLMEAADVKFLPGKSRLLEALDRQMDGVLIRFHHRPSELDESDGIRRKSVVCMKYIMDAATIFFLFLAGLVSAGQLWPTAMRRSIFSIGSRDDETLDMTQSEDSLLRRNSCDHRDAFASLQEQLRSLESEVQDLSDAVKEMHTDVWRVLEK